MTALSQLSVLPKLIYLLKRTKCSGRLCLEVCQIFLSMFPMCWQFVLAVVESQVSLFMDFVKGGRVLLSPGGGLELSLTNVCVTAKVCDKISGLKIGHLFNATKICKACFHPSPVSVSLGHHLAVWSGS